MFGFTWQLSLKNFLLLAICWTFIQSFLGISGVYQDIDSIPPKALHFGILPTLVFMTIVFITKKGRTFIDQIDLKMLTHFHSIRLDVEIILALLFYQDVVSVLMTFEGTNFDLFSGVTAPIVGYLAYRNSKANKKLLSVWNIICLVLLVNIVITAVFVLPYPFQKLAFDQPNIAVLYFPFNLLLTVVVPLVMFYNLLASKRLSYNK